MTAFETMPVAPAVRLKLAVRGAVQGVGFRPFVYRLANELALTGWVNNSPQGVLIEVEGARVELEQFRHRLEAEKPPRSSIQSCETVWLDAVGYAGFAIHASETSGDKTTVVLPDVATCRDCLCEILDPTNRRHRYPFTNCTNCGPRFSIIEALPYDRANTSMRSFKMCLACRAEYDQPSDRRFHAQPNACPVCGPRLELWNPDGKVVSCDYNALRAAAGALHHGQIVAVKGLGGFHLMVDARNDKAVGRLRERKHREEKPFALMFPSLKSVREVCGVSSLEERLLCSPESPIVLLRRKQRKTPTDEMFQRMENSERESAGTFHPLAQSVAPANPNLGVMLPSNPLHHLLLAELGFPVVATSGNLSDEPICTDEFEALARLHGIADLFLVHNRPVVRHLDDSVVRVTLDREMILRRARGYAPLPITVAAGILPAVEPGILPGGNSEDISDPSEISHPVFDSCAIPGGKMPPSTAGRMPAATILAVGAHLKNSVALAVGEQVFLSQHIGDLETEPANNAFRRVAADLSRLYGAPPEVIAADLHPDYLSTKFAQEASWTAPAERSGDGALEKPASTVADPQAVSRFACHRSPKLIQVQHHIAHVLSCMAENGVELPALGVAWDGTGYGSDGTIWGGEFFLVTADTVKRVAHLRPFRLPGGDAAVKEPRRAALGLLHELANRSNNHLSHLQQMVVLMFSQVERAALETALARGFNSCWCSSVGRLFDAVAALVGLRQQAQFEGQAAMELEFALDGIETDAAYGLSIANRQSPMQLDWAAMIAEIGEDLPRGISVGEISAKFHNALAEAIVQVARQVDQPRVALSGGCFQNRYLTERAVKRLRAEGFQPYWHQRVSPNDGGIALGQIVAARRELAARRAAFTPRQLPKCGSVSFRRTLRRSR